MSLPWLADDGAVAFISFTGQGHGEYARLTHMTWHESTETTWQRVWRWLHLPSD
jgi:hypothetical protein